MRCPRRWTPRAMDAFTRSSWRRLWGGPEPCETRRCSVDLRIELMINWMNEKRSVWVHVDSVCNQVFTYIYMLYTYRCDGCAGPFQSIQHVHYIYIYIYIYTQYINIIMCCSVVMFLQGSVKRNQVDGETVAEGGRYVWFNSALQKVSNGKKLQEGKLHPKPSQEEKTGCCV